jgi:hypothetical protein
MTSTLDIDFYVNWKERLGSHPAQLAGRLLPTVDTASSLLAVPSAILFALCAYCVCSVLLLLGVLWSQTGLSGLPAT